MDTKAAVLVLMGIWGVGTCGAVPAVAQESEDTMSEGEADKSNLLLNKAWVLAEQEDHLPGPMQIFLSDGTLVTDSCWETYRLSRWQQVSDTAISWDEDGMTINADIASLSETELVLNLHLGSEITEYRYVPATVPYLCPDIPK